MYTLYWLSWALFFSITHHCCCADFWSSISDMQFSAWTSERKFSLEPAPALLWWIAALCIVVTVATLASGLDSLEVLYRNLQASPYAHQPTLNLAHSQRLCSNLHLSPYLPNQFRVLSIASLLHSLSAGADNACWASSICCLSCCMGICVSRWVVLFILSHSHPAEYILGPLQTKTPLVYWTVPTTRHLGCLDTLQLYCI